MLKIETNPINIIFRVVLVIIGIFYLAFRMDSPAGAATAVFKYLFLILGLIYIIYKLIMIENQGEKVIYIISVVIGLILIVTYNGLFDVGDCSLKDPCQEGSFCATDHLCHKFPEYTNTINKMTIHQQKSFTFGGMMIGLSLILSAFILRKTSFYSKIDKKINRIKNHLKRKK